MTDDKRFFDAAEHAAPPAMAALPLAEWAALPLAVRLADKLLEVLIIASEVRAELECEEAAPVGWIVPEIDDVIERIDGALQRLAS
ncbi:MAG: hypothetical protein ABI779_23710 [Acidobacteriota bacterium]